MSNFNPQDYRPCVGIIIQNKENQIFVGQRLDFKSDAWQLPQGGVDDGEDTLTAAYREAKEETGILEKHLELKSEYPDWLYYDLPDVLQGKLWKGKYKGQRQKWYLFSFLGSDEDINIQTEIPEFSEWKWQSIDHLVEEIVPFKKDIYKKLVEWLIAAV